MYCLPVVILSSCVTLPKEFQKSDEIVKVGAGPEDAVLNEWNSDGKAHLLISCNSRRKNEPYYGEINDYDFSTGKVTVVPRIEPSSIKFNPHGIDLVKVKDSVILLVVNHNSAAKENSIIRYLYQSNKLFFINQIIDPLITSPNAVTGFADGTLLISNDSKKTNSLGEVIFKIRKARIVFWDGKKCSIASDYKYCYTNGITNRYGKVYLASTRQNKVWRFDFSNGKMTNRQLMARAFGADNLRIVSDKLLVVCHLRMLAFLKHFADSSKFSPTTVYSIGLKDNKREVVYYDSGKQLSAGSTAVIHDGKIYVVGIFDPKMAVRKMEK
jgi:hypothetical protein